MFVLFGHDDGDGAVEGGLHQPHSSLHSVSIKTQFSQHHELLPFSLINALFNDSFSFCIWMKTKPVTLFCEAILFLCCRWVRSLDCCFLLSSIQQLVKAVPAVYLLSFRGFTWEATAQINSLTSHCSVGTSHSSPSVSASQSASTSLGLQLCSLSFSLSLSVCSLEFTRVFVS